MPKLMSRSTFDQIETLLQSGEHTLVAIGRQVGVYASVVGVIARGRHFYQADEAEQTRRRGHAPPYTPTPEEIAEACAQIRETWAEERLTHWTPPMFPEPLLCA